MTKDKYTYKFEYLFTLALDWEDGVKCKELLLSPDETILVNRKAQHEKYVTRLRYFAGTH